MVNTSQSTSQHETLSEVELRNKFLIDSLKQVYGAEKQWLTALPILQLAVGCEDLVETLQKLQKDGNDHIHRLESIFEALGVKIDQANNKDTEVLIEECYDIIDITPRGSFIRDAGLVVGMQQVQQYQITAYTSLMAHSLAHGEQKIINLLKVILHHKQQEEGMLAMAGTSNMLDEIV